MAWKLLANLSLDSSSHLVQPFILPKLHQLSLGVASLIPFWQQVWAWVLSFAQVEEPLASFVSPPGSSLTFGWPCYPHWLIGSSARFGAAARLLAVAFVPSSQGTSFDPLGTCSGHAYFPMLLRRRGPPTLVVSAALASWLTVVRRCRPRAPSFPSLFSSSPTSSPFCVASLQSCAWPH